MGSLTPRERKDVEVESQPKHAIASGTKMIYDSSGGSIDVVFIKLRWSLFMHIAPFYKILISECVKFGS